MYIPLVCQINVSAVNPRYQVLLEMCVCDLSRKNCMPNKWDNHPGFEYVVDFLRNEICKNGVLMMLHLSSNWKR